MQRSLSRSLFIAALVAGLFYVAATAHALPALVASHFSASGQPNGFMTHDGYLAFMLVFVAGVPALAVGVGSSAYRSGRRLNLPHADYWLAPQRRDATIAFLVAHAQWLGILLVLFLCLVHRLVLQANAVQPPRLPGSMFGAVVVPLLLLIALWAAVLMLRLRRPS